MKYRLLVLALAIFTSCAKEEILEDVCITGDCDSTFFIDPLVQPDSYQDENGYYHIEYWGPNYFTIKGELDQLDDNKTVNGVPLTETVFDSNYWIWIEDLRFEVPLYSPFASFADDQFFVPIPVATMMLKMCNLYQDGTVYNIAGYTYNDRVCGDCHPEGYSMGTYSKNTYKPQQQFYLDQKMVGDTISIYVKTKFNYDLGNSEEVSKEFKIIVD